MEVENQKRKTVEVMNPLQRELSDLDDQVNKNSNHITMSPCHPFPSELM
jgi:hypothetical protein